MRMLRLKSSHTPFQAYLDAPVKARRAGRGLGPAVLRPAELASVPLEVGDCLAACAAPAVVPTVLPGGALRANSTHIAVWHLAVVTRGHRLDAGTKATSDNLWRMSCKPRLACVHIISDNQAMHHNVITHRQS